MKALISRLAVFLLVPLLMDPFPSIRAAGFTTPGTSFDGVKISAKDSNKKLSYILEIDSGEVVKGGRGFLKFGVLPVIKIKQLKLVLHQASDAISLINKDLLGGKAGRIEVDRFELHSIEHNSAPLMIINNFKINGKKMSGKLESNIDNPLTNKLKELLK
jgi:hypothetical protein